MELKKTLGLFDALVIGIGAIVGAGIFVVTGIAAAISNFASLLYYAIANYAALKLEKLLHSRIIPVLGLISFSKKLLNLLSNIYYPYG